MEKHPPTPIEGLVQSRRKRGPCLHGAGVGCRKIRNRKVVPDHAGPAHLRTKMWHSKRLHLSFFHQRHDRVGTPLSDLGDIRAEVAAPRVSDHSAFGLAGKGGQAHPAWTNPEFCDVQRL